MRIVAATNEDLPRLADQGRFRADLLDRLSFEVITLPPLRAREGDVQVLADYFGRRMATEIGWPGWPGFSATAAAQLEAYQWPGNVRELRNVIERAVYRWDTPRQPIARIEFDPFESPWRPPVLEGGVEVQADSCAPVIGKAVAAAANGPDHGAVNDLRAAVDAHEKAILEFHLARHRYNQRATAKALGLSYDQLRHCLRKHGLLEKTAG